jgi:hypothetical protein
MLQSPSFVGMVEHAWQENLAGEALHVRPQGQIAVFLHRKEADLWNLH